MLLQLAINWATPYGRDMRRRWARTVSSILWRLTAIGRWQLPRFVSLKILDTYLRPRPPKIIVGVALNKLSSLAVQRADQIGCSALVSETLYMLEHSYRNLQRAGFKEAYEKEVYEWSA